MAAQFIVATTADADNDSLTAQPSLADFSRKCSLEMDVLELCSMFAIMFEGAKLASYLQYLSYLDILLLMELYSWAIAYYLNFRATYFQSYLWLVHRRRFWSLRILANGFVKYL